MLFGCCVPVKAYGEAERTSFDFVEFSGIELSVMTESDISVLMGEQSRYPCFVLPEDQPGDAAVLNRHSGSGRFTVALLCAGQPWGADSKNLRPLETSDRRVRIAGASWSVIRAGECAHRGLVRDGGYRRIVVAGGETSGAVIQAVDAMSFRIEENAAPGVPELRPVNQPNLGVVLKSGNFGDGNFFLTALSR